LPAAGPNDFWKSQITGEGNRFWTANQNPVMQDSIEMLPQVWKSISQFEVLDAWEMK
jgi:hypothetical protein